MYAKGKITAGIKIQLGNKHLETLSFIRTFCGAGYGVLRKCSSGHKIGPLFADSPDVAESLFLALKAHAPEGAPVFLDTPEVNITAVKLAERHHMSVVFETARMYKGKSPELPLNRIFGVSSFELG